MSKVELAKAFVEVLYEIADEIFPESNNVKRCSDRYVSEIAFGEIPPYWSLECGGVVRMSLMNDELVPVDDSWNMDSHVYNGTFLDHWNAIKEKYVPEAKRIMRQIREERD